jgi:plasmid stabilization system protein ParE
LKPYVVTFTEAAESDLFAIYNYIASRASPTIALGFVERIEKYCLAFGEVPESGTRRDELRPGLRTAGFRRRATILFEVDHDARKVIIHGVYYAGRNISLPDDD